MKTFILISVLVALVFWGLLGLSLLVISGQRDTKISRFVKRHIITDEDLEV